MTNKGQDAIKTAIEKMGPDISPKVKKMVEEAANKIKVEGVLPREALGFTPAMMEEIYKYGYKQFQGGKYKEALKVFSFLRQLDITQYRYSFAIGACHHYLSEYSDAAANYILCTYLDLANPIPCFHLYDCFMKLNEPLSAMRALNETLALAKLSSRYEALQEKALLEQESLEKAVKKYLKENFNGQDGAEQSAKRAREEEKGESP